MRTSYLTLFVLFSLLIGGIHAQTCTPITLDCPDDITITADGGECGAFVSYTVATIGDCALVSITQIDASGLGSGNEFPIGATTQSYASLDTSGNTDTCSFDIIILEYPNPIDNDACNNSINLSPDADCQALVTADMILEGGPYGCYANYQVVITTQAGDPVPNPITSTYIGETLIAMVLDPNGNSCWGYLVYEDYFITQLACKSMDIDCRNEVSPSMNPVDSVSFPIPDGFLITPSSGIGPFIVTDYDNCGDIALSFTDNIVEIDCTLGGPYTRTIYRLWTAVDGQGNSTSCTDTVNLRIPSFSATNIFPDRDGTDAPGILCSGSWDANMDDIPQPDEIGDVLNMNCDVWGEYVDDIHYLACGFIIHRSWQVVNMCTGEFISFVQKIRLIDDEAPIISCPPTLIGSTNLHDCQSDYHVPAPTISDDCSEVTYEVTASVGVVVNNGTALYPAYVIQDLDLGTYSITYTAVDGCGNIATCTSQLIIEDQVPPIINCESNLTYYLDGTDLLYPSDLLVYSQDPCGIASVKLRRVVQGMCDGSSQDDLDWHDAELFCCEDAGQSILIEVGVWDIHGNLSTCIANVFVESNTAPSLTCPPNITVSCSYEIDFNDLTVFGDVVSDPGEAEQIIIDDRDWVEYCKGQTYSGPRVWGQDGLALSECDFTISEEMEINTSCGRSKFVNGEYLPAIIRTFLFKNESGVINSCEQFIYILDCNPQTTSVTWPADVVIDGCIGGSTDPADTGMPIVAVGSCDEITTTYNDSDAPISGDTCRHIIRHWVATSSCNTSGDSIVGEYDQNIYIIKSDMLEILNCLDTIRPTLNSDGVNLIYNGDFELGDVGFTSDYGQFPMMAGGYVVDTLPSDYNPDHDGVDHTTGSGNMLIVDGSEDSDDDVWCQKIIVEEDVEYVLSAWVNNLIRPSLNFGDPTITFTIKEYSNLVLINTGIINENPNVWRNFTRTFRALSSDTITLCISSSSGESIGNDFAIDDIEFYGNTNYCELNPANGCEVYVRLPQAYAQDCGETLNIRWDIDFDYDAQVGFVSDLNGVNFLPEYLPFGQHIIRWTATDMCGAEVSCENVLILNDCIAPLALCDDIGVQVIQDTNGIIISAMDIAGGSIDNCGDVVAQFLICEESAAGLSLFGIIDSNIVEIDENTGALLKIIPIKNVNGRDLGTLQYVPSEDMFYTTINGNWPRPQNPELAKIDRQGNLTSIGEISMVGSTIYFAEGSVYVEEEDLFIMTGNTTDGGSNSSIIFIIDRATGQVIESFEQLPGRRDLDHLSWYDGRLIAHDYAVNDGSYFFSFDILNAVGTVIREPLFSLTEAIILTDFARMDNILYSKRERELVKIDLESGVLTSITSTHNISEFNGNTIRGFAFAPTQTTSCTLTPEINISCDDLSQQIDTFNYTIVVNDQGGNTDTCRGEIIVADSNELCTPPRCELIYAITSVTGEYYSINTATGEFKLISSTGITTGNNAVAVNDDLGIGYFGTLQTVHWVDLIDGTTGTVGDLTFTGTLSAAAASYKNGYLYLGPEQGSLIQDIHRIKIASDGKSFDSTLENLTNGSVPIGNFGDFIVLEGDLGNERMIMSIFNNSDTNNIYEYLVATNSFNKLSFIPSTNSSQITIDNVGNIWYFSNETSILGIIDIHTGIVTNGVVVDVLIADMGRAWCPPSPFSNSVDIHSVIQFVQNVPNPFTLETIIEFQLVEPQDVRLTIYTIEGRLIESVDINGSYGLNSWRVDDELAAGTYIYQLQTHTATVSNKMVRVE